MLVALMDIDKATLIDLQDNSMTPRDVIRHWLGVRGKNIRHLAAIWSITPKAAYRVMYQVHKTVSAERCVAFATAMQLDPVAANAFYMLGAMEAGWPLALPVRR